MALTNAGKNVMLTALAAQATTASLHTGDPGTTGANEATGGSPAYARKTIAWGTATNGSIAASTIVFDVPAGTYSYFGLWNGSTFLGGSSLSQTEVFAAQGQLQLTDSIGI